MGKYLIVGAASAIAEATMRRLAARGEGLFLVGRQEERLAALAKDLKIRGASAVAYAVMDANEMERHAAVIEDAATALGGLDAALIAHGTLPDQAACQRDAQVTLNELTTNFLSTVSLCTHLANRFESQGRGSLAVISSVAGDRGRQSNYVYGSAKGGVSLFLQGLRNRLHRHGVHVATIKPGFVDTPMTAQFKKGLLWRSPTTLPAALFALSTRSASLFMRLVLAVDHGGDSGDP